MIVFLSLSKCARCDTTIYLPLLPNRNALLDVRADCLLRCAQLHIDVSAVLRQQALFLAAGLALLLALVEG